MGTLTHLLFRTTKLPYSYSNTKSPMMNHYQDSNRSEKTKRFVPVSIKIPKNQHRHCNLGGDMLTITNFMGGQQRRRYPHVIYHPVSQPIRTLRTRKMRLRRFEENGFTFDLGFSVYQNRQKYVLTRATWDLGKRAGWVIMSPRQNDKVVGYCVHDATAENYPPTGTAWTPISLPSINCSDEPILHSETDESVEDESCFRITEGELQL